MVHRLLGFLVFTLCYAFIVFFLAARPGHSATLTWQAPTANEDGSPVTLQGYKVYADCGSGFAEIAAVGNVTTTQVVNCGSYYVTALSTGGESKPSNIAYLNTSSPNAPVIVCSKCADLIEVWRVQPWRSGDASRSVYSPKGFPAVKIRIGSVAVGTTCEEYVNDYRNWSEWSYRMVTMSDGKRGVSVCKKSSH